MKNVALIVDKPDWAFHRIAKKIKHFAPRDFTFSIYFTELMNVRNFFKLEANNYDLVHFFWRPHVLSAPKLRSYKLTTAVYDHLYIDNLELTRSILAVADNVYCSSPKLQSSYIELFGAHFDICLDGVDLVQFANPLPSGFHNGPLRIGWAGASKALGNDHKGYYKILLPVLERLRDYQLDFLFVPADASTNPIPHALMPQYFRSIDVFLCTSLSEGTPNPILEACASGVPWISTDVGLVSLLAEQEQKAYVVERDVGAFFDAICDLNNVRSKLEVLSRENLIKIEQFAWEKVLTSHFDFFSKTLATV
jgi:hypothetical protein